MDSRGEWAKRLLRVFGCALAAVVVEGVVMVTLLQAADQARHAPGAAERIMACEEEKQGWSDANYSFQLLHKVLSALSDARTVVRRAALVPNLIISYLCFLTCLL